MLFAHGSGRFSTRNSYAAAELVGGDDHHVVALNRDAYDVLHYEGRLAIVPGASHLFEEAGTPEDVAALATNWFVTHFFTLRRSSQLEGKPPGYFATTSRPDVENPE